VNEKQFWKNFALGEELDIAGRFIYNGLRFFHEMETLSFETEIFEVLYNLSVGLERLLKIAVILIEHTDMTDQATFEDSLITHSHLELLERVRKKHALLVLAGPHHQLLQMLGEFYKTQRYGRFILAASTATTADATRMQAFFEKHLKVKLDNGESIIPTENNARLRRFLGKTVCTIARTIYKLIGTESRGIGLNTHDIRNATKASKIFLDDRSDFMEEDVLWRELLVYLVNSDITGGHLGIIKDTKPLEFDPGLMVDYLQCFESEERKLRVLDELDALYEDIPDKDKRIKSVMLIGHPDLDFTDETDADAEECDG
jgi:hypothetical protein